MTQPYLAIAETGKSKRQAQDKLNNAVKGGLRKPERCETCGEGGELQAHHFRGYKAEHRLSIKWLCRECHAQADHDQREREDRLWSATVSLEYA